MTQLNNANVLSVGMTEYTDCKKNVHTVKHSVIFTKKEKQEHEDKIVDDLYRIFTNNIKD